MKIALLAPSRAGKTAYLTVLHNVLSRQLSNNSYGIDFTISDDIKRGHLETRFTRLLKNKDFGEGSREKITYPLTMTTRNSNGDPRSLNVDIVDFPGGYLYDVDEANPQTAEQTKDALAACDGFIVFLDGSVLIEGMTTMRQERTFIASETKPDSVQNILKSALERHRTEATEKLTDPNVYAFGKGQIPVAFVLTKADQLEALAVQHTNFDKDLTLTVKRQFSPANFKEYYDSEVGNIPNLISSQYGKIIKMSGNQVVTLRTDTSVYNETDGVIEPRNPEHLLQFVIFQGLRNAVTEYERRIADWEKDQAEKDKKQQFEKGAFERVNAIYQERMQQPIWRDLVGLVIGEEGHVKVGRRREDYHADMVRATEEFNKSSSALEQVKDNMATAQLFLERILSDKLVHMLTYGTRKDSLNQQGLSISNLSLNGWWQKKSWAGAEIIKQEEEFEKMLREPT